MNKRMLRRAVLALAIAGLAVASFGNPERHIADLFWSDDAAPWENVTAVYTPDRSEPQNPDYRGRLYRCCRLPGSRDGTGSRKRRP